MSRDQVDLDKIFDEHAEQFECFCNDNLDFSNALVAVFGDRVEQYKVWKTDCTETRFEVECQAFDFLYAFCAELCVESPIECLKSYKRYLAQDDEVRREFNLVNHGERV